MSCLNLEQTKKNAAITFGTYHLHPLDPARSHPDEHDDGVAAERYLETCCQDLAWHPELAY